MVLDEIHRAPKLFQTLRGVIDEGRRKGKGVGRFLVLGFASLDLLRQSESLAGRIEYVNLGPFSPLEVADDRASRERLWLRMFEELSSDLDFHEVRIDGTNMRVHQDATGKRGRGEVRPARAAG